ncbi:MAG: hypothetical protein Q8N35_18130 [Methylococcaceae bacterium]|jgi:hypothetical protein|nr:hypothetical protein [Methylococcaceae bacterium]MDZ4155095.1 hypothetical protein [Methylococcales bacterium]MDP2394460.1 hypothetical protein [Methylococcaceae bacterium]MDP3021503.1 hypothetical protein [Methylococcaceae bacterium]MDP3390378.1 hypothetical protein [Methylococcaceae bacterium]
MSDQSSLTPSQEAQAMLDCLRQAVANTLERKRRLGQYAVLWSGGTAITVGEDAPVQLVTLREPSQD